MRILFALIPVLALSVSTWSVALKAAADETKTARGTVTAMTKDSFTVKVGTKDMKFSVDDQTSAVAPGGSRASAAGGGRTEITTVVGQGDTVTLDYHDMNGSMHASEIRVTAKAK